MSVEGKPGGGLYEKEEKTTAEKFLDRPAQANAARDSSVSGWRTGS